MYAEAVCLRLPPQAWLVPEGCLVRKSSDMASLLGSRGRSRPRGGFVQGLRSVVNSWLGRSRSRERSRGFELSGWLVAGSLLAAFAGGFLVRDRVGDFKNPAGLDAKPSNGAVGSTPAFQLELETRPIHNQCFVVAAYDGLAEADGKAQAKALAEYLRGKKLLKARPFPLKTAKGTVWLVCVYYDGDTELLDTRNQLRGLPEDVPDGVFVALRASSEKDLWPRTWVVR